MKKKLRKTGSSYALTITKTMLEILDVEPEKDMIDLRFEGSKLIVTKAEPLKINKEIHP